MNIVIITGASSGIGREFARQLDRIMGTKIDEFWLIARRQDRLEALSEKLLHRTRSLSLDLCEAQDMEILQVMLAAENPVLRMLVNCAGYGILGQFDEQSLPEETGMIDLNCRALTAVTHICIPYMRKNSRILQLASSAAFLPQKGFAVYAATKAYVLSFCLSLGEELKKKGIIVTAVCPGPVETAFFKTAEKYGSTLAIKKLTMVKPQRVVRDALQASFLRKRKSVCSLPIQAFELMTKLLPHALILTAMRFLK